MSSSARLTADEQAAKKRRQPTCNRAPAPAAIITAFDMRCSMDRHIFPIVLFVLLLFILGSALGYLFIQTILNSSETEQQRKSDKIYLRSLVDAVNNDTTNTWKARFNPFGIRNTSFTIPLSNATKVRAIAEELKTMFASDAMQSHLQQLVDYKETLPSHFDAREKWPLCRSIGDVPNQGGCGSCYAVAAIGVASDRVCIASNGTNQPLFSVQDFLSCCTACAGCSGGDVMMGLHYWTTQGLVTGGRDGCIPYTADIQCGTPCAPPEFKPAVKCKRQCQNVYTRNSYENDRNIGSLAYPIYSPRGMIIFVTEEEYLEVPLPTIANHFNISRENLTDVYDIVKKELLLFGPVTISFPVTEEFLHYSEGVYHPYPRENYDNRTIYLHTARVIGWGTENGVTNWLVVNSFGHYWGDNGLFRIEADLTDTWNYLEFNTGIA